MCSAQKGVEEAEDGMQRAASADHFIAFYRREVLRAPMRASALELVYEQFCSSSSNVSLREDRIDVELLGERLDALNVTPSGRPYEVASGQSAETMRALVLPAPLLAALRPRLPPAAATPSKEKPPLEEAEAQRAMDRAKALAEGREVDRPRRQAAKKAAAAAAK